MLHHQISSSRELRDSFLKRTKNIKQLLFKNDKKYLKIKVIIIKHGNSAPNLLARFLVLVFVFVLVLALLVLLLLLCKLSIDS